MGLCLARRDSLAVDDAGARAQAAQRLDNQREAMGEVIAGTAIEPHLRTFLASDDPKTVVLDLMQPIAAGGQFVGFGWKARRDEASREGTLQHVDEIKWGNGECNFIIKSPHFLLRVVFGHGARGEGDALWQASARRVDPHWRVGFWPRHRWRRGRTCTRAAEDRLAALRASDGGGNEGF